MSEIRPLIAESSTAESTQVQVVLNDLLDRNLIIPDYQRDSDQWDLETKSLLIESIINNLTIPAFFFEVSQKDGIEINEVVDGQQRITTLNDFFNNKIQLVTANEAPYISPNSVHYAGKYYKELPIQYQKSFKNYRLSIIKLRNLGDMKLEIFRRINQGGTPLSGQDIRLAYYGDKSPSVTFIRLVGVYDETRISSERTIKSAFDNYKLNYPWNTNFWKEWWDKKEISQGQKPSEMFLWSLISIYHQELNNLIQDSKTLDSINCRYHNTIEEALDAFCGYLKYQDLNPELPRLFIELDDLTNSFINFFMTNFNTIALSGSSLSVTRYRLIASVIGNLYAMNKSFDSLSDESSNSLLEFIRHPQQQTTDILKETYPLGKGRWAGTGGYHRQFQITKEMIKTILKDEIS